MMTTVIRFRMPQLVKVEAAPQMDLSKKGGLGREAFIKVGGIPCHLTISFSLLAVEPMSQTCQVQTRCPLGHPTR